MIGFQEYLINKGFLPFRKCFINKEWKYTTSKEAGISDNSFSTNVSGGLDIRYLKDNVEIIYGLEEVGKPPTILWPKLNAGNGNLFSQLETERLLKKYSNEEVFEALFNENKILELCE